MSFDLEKELMVATKALAETGVSYALCGGLALAVHGHPRATKDIDFLVPAGSVGTGLEALGRAGFTLRAGPIPPGTAGPHPQRRFRATKVSGGARLTVDLLEVSASDASAWDTRVSLEWKGQPRSVVSRQGLIDMKRLSTRLKDRADVETLEGSAHED